MRRATIEVAILAKYFSEWWGSLTPNRPNFQSCVAKNFVVYFTAMGLFIGQQF